MSYDGSSSVCASLVHIVIKDGLVDYESPKSPNTYWFNITYSQLTAKTLFMTALQLSLDGSYGINHLLHTM